jgi:uncharacterized protein (TIGR02611 family)
MRSARLTSSFEVLNRAPLPWESVQGSNKVWPETVRQARRVIVLIVGLTLLLCGVVMLITPGPGWLLIFAGLSILALEFVWARDLLKKIKVKGNELSRTMFDSHKR